MGSCLGCRSSDVPIKDKSTKICSLQAHSIVPFVVGRLVPSPVEFIITRRLNNPSSRMSTSFNNMNITNPIKELVSKKRIRYVQDGFNLDLTYITDQVIAMGYPASFIEGCYRNKIEDVVRLLEGKHKDHYQIYNLCSERTYNTAKFHNRVKVYPFDDHNPPKIDLIKPFCDDMANWLKLDKMNVAAVHCKAGKGRTGTMICCYLLHCGMFKTADEALNYYGKKRTQNTKGVTIPSQVRYVEYYAKLLQGPAYEPVSLYITDFILEPPPMFLQGGVHFTITSGSSKNKNKSNIYEIKKGVKNLAIKFDACVPIMGDIKIEVYSKSKISKVKQFQFWFNTFFVCDELPINDMLDSCDQNGISGSGIGSVTNERTFYLTLNKNKLDIVNKKDKANKTFTSDFKISLHFHKVPSKSAGWLSPSKQLIEVQDTTPSGSSDGDTSYDEDFEEEWDSVVENDAADPRGVGYRLLSECELSSQLTNSPEQQQPQRQHSELLTV